MAPEFMGSETARRLSAGPTAQHVDGFVAALRAQGLDAASIRSKLTFVAQLERWLMRRQLPLTALDEARVRESLRSRRRRCRSAAAAAATTRHLLRHLRGTAVVSWHPAAPPRHAASRAEAAYVEYLRRERALADVTIADYVNLVRPLLAGRGSMQARSFARIEARDVTHFVVQQAQRRGYRQSWSLHAS